MSDTFPPRVGGVFSADIAVPEHERELRFYSRVLSTGEIPLWREDLMNNLGVPIIGLGARSAEYADLPLQWMPHIQVADVAASVECALDLGGRELMHARDDDRSGRLPRKDAILQTRLTSSDRKLIYRAAENAGRRPSAWAREVLVAIARFSVGSESPKR